MINFDEQDFLKTYRGTETFVTNEREYYLLFLKLLKDGELLEKIRFANDFLKIPPLKSFILHERGNGNKIFDKKMSPVAKRGLGACFGYLYKFIYKGYGSEPSWFNDEKTTIKTASYFIKKEI